MNIIFFIKILCASRKPRQPIQYQFCCAKVCPKSGKKLQKWSQNGTKMGPKMDQKSIQKYDGFLD